MYSCFLFLYNKHLVWLVIDILKINTKLKINKMLLKCLIMILVLNLKSLIKTILEMQFEICEGINLL
jgi:hypothetical protein